MDILYPARKMRHGFAKAVNKTADFFSDENEAKALTVVFGTSALLPFTAVLGGIVLEDVAVGEIHPDNQQTEQSVYAQQVFEGQISDLAEERAQYLATQQQDFLSPQDKHLTERQQSLSRITSTAEDLAGRIVMTEGLSEQQAASLLGSLSAEVLPIEDLGYSVSDFGHLREVRAEYVFTSSENWTDLAKDITAEAANEDAHDEHYPLRLFSEDAETVSKVGALILAPLFGTMLGGLISLLLIAGTLTANGPNMKKWAREVPKPQNKPSFKH